MAVHADLSQTRAVASTSRRSAPNEDLRWWRADEDTLHERVWSVANRIRENMSRKRVENFTYALMYNALDVTEMYGAGADFDAGNGGRITYNVVQDAIDTASSMIAKNRPKPLFLTDGADYETFLKAQDLTRYVGGVIDDADVYAKSERVFTEGAIFGLGGIKFWGDAEAGRIRCELVPQHEILVDEVDGVSEAPRQIHQRKYVSRDVLIEEYPDQEEAIEMASSDLRNASIANTVGDVIAVVESWHLRSGPKAKDGLHSIVIEGATLLSERYDKDYFPILFWRWYSKTSGFWGRGIAQEIGRIQRTINKILRTIDEAQDLMAIPVWFVKDASLVNWDQLLSNDIGRAIEYTGDTPPQAVTPTATAPELVEYVWALVDRAYRMVGVSQGMAEGTKPAGVESAAAVREVADIANGRFQCVGQRWEAFFVAIGKVIVDLSHDLFTSTPELAIKATEEGQLRSIQWKDVKMDVDRYRISVFPVSGLPSTPAGRLATITEWMQAGWITKEQAMSLLNMPDLQRFSDLETSTIDLTQQTIGEIKRFDRYTADQKPIGQMNLNLAMQIATMEKVLAKKQKLGDSVLSKIDLYLADLNTLMAQQAPPPAPPPGPPGAPPGAPPMPVGAPPPPMPPMAAAA